MRYREVPGWAEYISGVRRWEDLPERARAYVDLLEDLTGTPVEMVSVGPERDAVIRRPR